MPQPPIKRDEEVRERERDGNATAKLPEDALVVYVCPRVPHWRPQVLRYSKLGRHQCLGPWVKICT